MKSRASATVFVLITAGIISALLVSGLLNAGPAHRVPVVVASVIEIDHDFTHCNIRITNTGNSTDVTRSVLIFYIPAGSQDSIVRNAAFPPSLTLPPGGSADWDCTPSFSTSPPGTAGGDVHVIISALTSRERDSVGTFG